MKIEAWSDSNVGLVRKTNQDAVGCFPDLRLFVVADGMGGRTEGEVASRIAVDTVRNAAGVDAHGRPNLWRRLFGAAPDDDNSQLAPAIELANERIYAAGRERRSEDAARRGSMGTTVVALEICNAESGVHWAWVGDSRLYRVRAGKLELLTADHTLFGEPYWKADATPVDLPHTNRLVRALGIAPTVQVAARSAALCSGDLFLLCSDGVSGMIAPTALTTLLCTERTVAATGTALIQAALDAGGRDNASALLVRVLED